MYFAWGCKNDNLYSIVAKHCTPDNAPNGTCYTGARKLDAKIWKHELATVTVMTKGRWAQNRPI